MKQLLLKPLNYYRRNGLGKTIKRAASVFYKGRQFTFSEIYEKNHWGNAESRSGFGSSVAASENIRTHLPIILSQWNLKEIIDAPCGDYNWMKLVKLSPGMRYTGIDIVPELIVENTRRYVDAQHRFMLVDLTTDPLPKGDLVLCRDCLFHLANKDIFKFLRNFVLSGTRFLLTTTHRNEDGFVNTDIATGGFRLIDLFAPPFSFPAGALYHFDETKANPNDPPREMCLWSRDQIEKLLESRI